MLTVYEYCVGYVRFQASVQNVESFRVTVESFFGESATKNQLRLVLLVQESCNKDRLRVTEHSLTTIMIELSWESIAERLFGWSTSVEPTDLRAQLPGPLSVADQNGWRVPFSLTFGVNNWVIVDVDTFASNEINEIVQNVCDGFNCALSFNDMVASGVNKSFAVRTKEKMELQFLKGCRSKQNEKPYNSNCGKMA